MKLRHTLSLLALGSLASTAAFAQDSTATTTWTLDNTITVQGTIGVGGYITADSESAALTQQDQATVLNLLFGDGDETASVSGEAMRYITGNVGANIAAGVGNAQANDVAIAALDSSAVFASATVESTQLTGANIATDFPSGPDNQLFYNATVGDSVLRNASGNIGLNVAAGTGNAQGNALAASLNSDGVIAKASSESEQGTILNILVALQDLDNTATLGDNALMRASGNIGVNIAAGAGNAQHNGMAIAVATGP